MNGLKDREQDLKCMRNNCEKKCNIDITRYGIFNITEITYDEKKMEIIAIIKNKFFDFHAACRNFHSQFKYLRFLISNLIKNISIISTYDYAQIMSTMCN